MIQPLNDLVVVELLEEEQASSGFIIVPDATKHQYAKVVAVGNGYFTETGSRSPLTVNVGDKVLLDSSMKYTATEVDGSSVVFVRERQILAIIK